MRFGYLKDKWWYYDGINVISCEFEDGFRVCMVKFVCSFDIILERLLVVIGYGNVF